MAGTLNASRRGARWTLFVWAITGLLLLTPAVAMRFTDEVKWDPGDFVFMGALLGGVCLGVELAVRMSGSLSYRAGASVALITGFLIVWINAAVGVIGGEEERANLLYLGPILVALAGAVVGRFRPSGMARAMVAAAAAMALVPPAASLVWSGFGKSPWSPEALILTGGFVGLWLFAGWLFRRAAR